MVYGLQDDIDECRKEIKQLRAQLKTVKLACGDLRKQRKTLFHQLDELRWRKVSEGLPEDKEQKVDWIVEITTTSKGKKIKRICDMATVMANPTDTYPLSYNFTHWMPIPPLPEEVS